MGKGHLPEYRTDVGCKGVAPLPRVFDVSPSRLFRSNERISTLIEGHNAGSFKSSVGMVGPPSFDRINSLIPQLSALEGLLSCVSEADRSPALSPRELAVRFTNSGGYFVSEASEKSLVRRLSAPLIFFLLTLASTVATVHAAENPRKMTVVSFGLFGDEGVFRREAAGAAQIVANRFGGDPVVVKYNTKTGGSATVETLATTLQAEAKKMNGESDILFLILTSHGSRDGLAVVAGRLAETLKPSHLSEMLGRTGVRNKVVIISACYSGVFIPRLADADTLVITAADANHPSFGCEDKAKWTYFGDAFFNAAT